MKSRTDTTCANIHKIDCGFDFDTCGFKCAGYVRKPNMANIEPQLNAPLPLGELPTAKKK